MVFSNRAAPRIERMKKGDQAILYVTRRAFLNPMRDEARLGGIVRVIDAPKNRRVTIGGVQFAWVVPFTAEVVLPERTGPPAAMMRRSALVKRPEVWGTYFRNSPIEVEQRDFDRMVKVIEEWPKSPRSH